MAVEKILEQPPIEKAPEKPAPQPERPADSGHRAERPHQNPDRPRSVAPTIDRTPMAGGGVSLAQNFQQQRAAAIDSILSEGLNEVFLKMSAQEQQAFQRKGEETVVKINQLLNQTKVKVNKIIALIKAWLQMIPGVNKLFLEQEAKIKADRILRIKDKV